MSDHKHKCNDCGTVWVHDRSKIDEDRWGNAHECPNCGRKQWYQFFGEAPATYLHDGTITKRLEPVKGTSTWQ